MSDQFREICADLFSPRTLVAIIVAAFTAGGAFWVMRGDIVRVTENDQSHHAQALAEVRNLRENTGIAIENSRRERTLQLDNIGQRVTALETQQRSLAEIATLFAGLKVEVSALNESNRDLRTEVRALRDQLPKQR